MWVTGAGWLWCRYEPSVLPHARLLILLGFVSPPTVEVHHPAVLPAPLAQALVPAAACASKRPSVIEHREWRIQVEGHVHCCVVVVLQNDADNQLHFRLLNIVGWLWAMVDGWRRAHGGSNCVDGNVIRIPHYWNLIKWKPMKVGYDAVKCGCLKNVFERKIILRHATDSQICTVNEPNLHNKDCVDAPAFPSLTYVTRLLVLFTSQPA